MKTFASKDTSVGHLGMLLFCFPGRNPKTILSPDRNQGSYLRVWLPRWYSGKSTCQYWKLRRPGFDPRVGKIPWRRARQSTPVFLPGETHGPRSLVGYSTLAAEYAVS